MFLTYKTSPDVYTFKDLSEVVSRGFKNEFEIRKRIRASLKKDESDSFIIESDNATLINKLNVYPEVHDLRFNRKSFLNTILASSPYCEYKVMIMNFLVKKNRNLSTIDKSPSKCDCINGPVLNGSKRQGKRMLKWLRHKTELRVKKSRAVHQKYKNFP